VNIYLYWLHLPSHSDINSQGYIGVSNNPKRRLSEHLISKNNPHLYRVLQKYPDEILQTIIFEGDEESCYQMEETLRPYPQIGWNINKGGSKPPSRTGCNHSQETLKKILLKLKGKQRSAQWCSNLSEAKKGSANGMYGRKIPCSKEKRLSLIIAKNSRNYHIYKEALEKMADGHSACSTAKLLGIGKNVCCKLKNGTHLIFEAFPELKQCERS
jgi:hypothetical protein